MFRFFDAVVHPILEAAQASVLVEVGSDRGPGTERLAEWCERNGAELHVIDPKPKYEVDEWAERWPGVVRFHVDLSLPALQDVPVPDVVLIDGDHNWYTVFHELELLAKISDGRGFPLTLLHDVGWPYGRRDLYYDPDTVPEEFRLPHRKGGIVPGRSALADRGFNDALHNAEEENTPRNGVLTAVEDFVEAQNGRLQLHVIPGLHGIAIIVDETARPELQDAVAEVTGPAGLRRVLTAVEDDRIKLLLERHELRRSTKQRSGSLRTRLASAERERDDLQRRVRQLDRRYRRLRNRRSVRACLRVAGLTRPVFTWVRDRRGRT